MKKLMLILVLLLMGGSIDTTSARGFGVSFGVFYGELSPYGRWIELGDDLVVWKPYKRYRNFKPYVRGNWIWTNYGWYWDSYEPFGHVVYHYGRWIYDDYYGWVWLPDYEWAPAWVEWCYNDDYVGWAPMRPVVNIYVRYGITYNFEKYRYRSYNFVKYRHFGSSSMDREMLSDNDNRRILDRGGLRNEVTRDRDRVINTGVDREIIKTRGGNIRDEKRIEITGRDSNDRGDLQDKDNSTIRVRVVDKENNKSDDNKDYQIERRNVKEDRNSVEDRKIENRRSGVKHDENPREVKERKEVNTDDSRVTIRRNEKETKVGKEPKETNNQRPEVKRNEVRENNGKERESGREKTVNRNSEKRNTNTENSKDERTHRKR